MPNSLAAVQMPAVSSTHMYHASTKTETSSPVAYNEPPTFSFADRPILENMSNSLELADYRQALRQSGMLPLLGRAGPFTVFAIPNEPFERYARQVPGGLMTAPNAAALKQVLGYTIIRGNWSPARLAKAMTRRRVDRLAFKTLSGDMLMIQRDSSNGEFVLVNTTGRVVKLWLNGAPQSNGTLYITQDILPPRG
ncbi:fasciclin domain-containing protein [Asaia krungthepensis]|uniref:fasciclin domain-containing protein n=1 Tax=Asaia krungthepensis TaxID=220990 RepID=UPI0022311919|nr:fasciclin domain-containing protein [Asaia krungthepensis]